MKLGNHSKIAISWLIFATTGITSFFIAKQYVHNNRFEAMKVRENIRKRLQSEKEKENKSD